MKFNIISKRILLLSASTFIFFGVLKTITNYYYTTQLEQEFVKRQARTLDSFMLMHRTYYQDLYVNKSIPLNRETLAGLPAYSSHIISENFSKQNSFNITVQAVSDRARNTKNLADKYEKKAILAFNQDPSLKEYFQREEDHYQYATPLFIEKKCLSCHGSKEKAPKLISDMYDKAYNYKIGDLRGLISIKIPTKEVNQYFMGQFFETLMYDLVFIFLIIIVAIFLIRYFKRLNIELEEIIEIRTAELINQREILKKSVYTDALTGLNNRIKLLDLLPDCKNPVLALINIDHFSQTNDFYGSIIGDQLIIELGRILQRMIDMKKDRYLFRLHGDEFVILGDDEENKHFSEEIALIINLINTTSIVIDGNEVPIEVTASISFEDASTLLATADIALKHAKKHKKILVVYSEILSIQKSYEKNMYWSKTLKEAIKHDRLVPYYQPIINNITGKTEKFEALIRLIDEDEKVISPFFFLDIAKQTKQYHHITKVVIDKSFKTFKSLDYEFSINLTIEDILDAELRAYIINMLSFYDIGPRVVFEIVESEGIENFSDIQEFIISVKHYGCKISIDDFGTGYSNFEYLMKLNVDYIKIDGSIIRHLDTDKNARILVSTIVAFAKNIGMKTIAEYVENEDIQNIVVKLGIDYSQGYCFSEPKAECVLFN